MIAIKPGVRIRGMQPEILLAVVIAREVYDELNQPLTLTSCTDGDHKPGSLHHTGNAVDLRLPGRGELPQVVKDLSSMAVAALADRLGAEYDVVLEKDHIHVEYDPKR